MKALTIINLILTTALAVCIVDIYPMKEDLRGHRQALIGLADLHEQQAADIQDLQDKPAPEIPDVKGFAKVVVEDIEGFDVRLEEMEVLTGRMDQRIEAVVLNQEDVLDYLEDVTMAVNASMKAAKRMAGSPPRELTPGPPPPAAAVVPVPERDHREELILDELYHEAVKSRTERQTGIITDRAGFMHGPILTP